MSEQSTTRRHWLHGDQSPESYGRSHAAAEGASAPRHRSAAAAAAAAGREPRPATLSCGGPTEEAPIDGTELVRQLLLSREARSFERPELREAVARLARHARAGGCPPERLVIAIKGLVQEALATVNDWFRGVMTERVVAWAISAYYDIDRRDDPR